MVVDFDDFGADHIISDACRSRDCRKELDALHFANPAFKVTLFAIPGEMTQELLNWCKANKSWVELAFHGFYHSSNYECEKLTYEEFDDLMLEFGWLVDFATGFKAPGWQISDEAYEWLKYHGWWVADQSYNNNRRPEALKAYVVDGKEFRVYKNGKPSEPVEAWHGHTWNCVGNGIEETFDHVKGLVQNAKEFKFVSEVLND